MKKSVFVNLIIGTVGGLLFALGMCMCLLPEWNAFKIGVVCTAIGAIVLLVQSIVAWIRSGRKIRINWKIAGKVLYGVFAALVLGVGMCMILVWNLMLPGILVGIDGFEFAQTVRSLNENIPIMFMTARDDFASKQRGFRIGVDDYMVKPIDLDELFLRIGALLRRARIASSRKLEVGRFSMDMDEHIAMLGDEEISLTNREFNILYKLLSYPKKTFTRQQLMDEFWDADTNTAPRAVDVYMTKLRTKLSDCEDFEIKTVHGLGYKAVVK